MEEEKFLTERQLRKKRRNEAIRARFAELRSKYENITVSRIYALLGEEFDLSFTAIIFIIKGRS